MLKPAQVVLFFRTVAILGLPIWLATALILELELAPALLLLGPLVCVPLGLALVVSADLSCRNPLWPWLALAHPVAAFCLVASFAIWPGPKAAAFALPWLAFTCAVAALGLERGVRLGRSSVADSGIAAGMVFLAVGGAWTTLSRYGARPLGFGEIIVLLTGVHFHFAGFALCVLTGLAARQVLGLLARIAVWGVAIGVPLVAVGITAGLHWHLVEALTAWFMSAAGLVAAALQMRAAWRLSRFPRALLILSALSLIGGIVLAAAYAFDVYFRLYWLTVDRMIQWHGSLNALGFALLGMLGWTVIERRHGSAE